MLIAYDFHHHYASILFLHCSGISFSTRQNRAFVLYARTIGSICLDGFERSTLVMGLVGNEI
jgi:hypothetical protein